MASFDLTARDEARERRQADGAKADGRRALRMGLFATGRLFLGIPFLAGGIEKLLDRERAELLLGATAIDVSGVVPLVAVAELALGAMVVLGAWARRAGAAGVVWVAAALLQLRPDLGTPLGRAVMIANVALAGGLLMMAAHGAGKLSVDQRREKLRRRRAAQHRG